VIRHLWEENPMRILVSGLGLLGLAFVLAAAVDAGGEKKKEVTLKGTITCGKCDLGVDKGCATVIVAKRDNKDVTIYFDAASHKKYHGDICTDAKKGTVTGTVTKDGKKEVIAVKELKYD
jgi:hypothetical protein